jgi:hypothetical protein
VARTGLAGVLTTAGLDDTWFWVVLPGVLMAGWIGVLVAGSTRMLAPVAWLSALG